MTPLVESELVPPVPPYQTFSQKMKAIFIILLLTSLHLMAAEQSWEIVRAVSERQGDKGIKITVTVRNVTKSVQVVTANPFVGEEGYAWANSYMWRDGATESEAMSSYSHYFSLHSCPCHQLKDFLSIHPQGEVSFIMNDRLSSVGNRLLLVFDIQVPRSVIGGLTIPEPKRENKPALGNPLPAPNPSRRVATNLNLNRTGALGSGCQASSFAQ